MDDLFEKIRNYCRLKELRKTTTNFKTCTNDQMAWVVNLLKYVCVEIKNNFENPQKLC